MPKIANRVASALSFAHFAGLGRSSARRAGAEEDEKDKARRAEEQEEEKDERAEGDDPDNDDDSGKDDKQSRRASDDDGDDKDPPVSKNAKRAKADGDDPEDDPDAEDDDDEEEMSGNSTAAKARARERSRFAAIFSSKAAARNPALALSLACNTSMTRKQVLQVLRDQPAAQAAPPANSGRANRNPNLGSDRGETTRQSAIAGSWDQAMKKATGG